MSAPNGGPAFPRPASEDTSGGTLHDGNYVEGAQDGMSMLDFFAAKAPFTIGDAILAANLEHSSPDLQVAVARVLVSTDKRAVAMAKLAELRVEYARAMLAERAKR